MRKRRFIAGCCFVMIWVSFAAVGQENAEYEPKYTIKDLLYSAEHGQLERVKKILKQGMDINAFDPHTYKSALIGAILYHRKEVVMFLLENGADPNLTNEVELGALDAGADETVVKFMDTLIDYGTDLSKVSMNSCRAIYSAASSRCDDEDEYQTRIKKLLGMGARQVLMSEYFPKYVGEDKRERTPLMVASRCNSLEVVKLLWANGGDVTIQDESGDTVLHYAVKSKNPKIMDFLLKVGAEPNINGKSGLTALHDSAWWGKSELVDTLIKHGAFIDVQDHFGETPLGRVISKCIPKEKVIKMTKLLIKAGADVSHKDHKGRTVLMLAAGGNDSSVEAARILIRAKADILAKDNEGKTALDHAIESGNVGIKRLLRAKLGKRVKGGREQTRNRADDLRRQ